MCKAVAWEDGELRGLVHKYSRTQQKTNSKEEKGAIYARRSRVGNPTRTKHAKSWILSATGKYPKPSTFLCSSCKRRLTSKKSQRKIQSEQLPYALAPKLMSISYCAVSRCTQCEALQVYQGVRIKALFVTSTVPCEFVGTSLLHVSRS